MFNTARFSFSETLSWLEPRSGSIPLTDKEIADDLAIGGLRNAPAAVARLHAVSTFGRQLGGVLMEIIMDNERQHLEKGTVHQSWIALTCDSIGSECEDAGPPTDAIAAIKSMLIEMTGMVAEDNPEKPKTKVADQYRKVYMPIIQEHIRTTQEIQAFHFSL